MDTGAGTNGALTYATGQVGLSGKLDATGEYVEVDFAEEPGVLTIT